MSNSSSHAWLHRFAVLTAGATLALLCIGGLVTSHGVGMAVPDWPNTYGYNMFFFPFSQWVGGIFYEHSHRLVASAVGLLTGMLALWLYGNKSRKFMRWVGPLLLLAGIASAAKQPARWQDGLVTGLTGATMIAGSFVWPNCEPAAKWLRRLGLIAFFAVVLQGVLGGLRVVLFKDEIGIFHATLAQLFFVLTCALALFTSQWWQGFNAGALASDAKKTPGAAVGSKSRGLILAATVLIFCQLVLGATMRHQHAGLAIPDFPLAYGKLWPATDADSIARYNQYSGSYTITAFQIELQMIHRIMAALILAAVGLCAWQVRRSVPRFMQRLGWTWLGLILTQVILGAFTIWSKKAADVATAHMLVGALSLATGSIMCIVSFYRSPSPRPAAILTRAGQDSPTGSGLAARAT